MKLRLRFLRRPENSSRSGHNPTPGTPRGYRLASHSEFVVAETDSTTQKSVPPPIAIAPARFRAQCCALRAKERCGGHADLAGLPQRHNHGRLRRNQDDGAGVLAFPVRVGWLRRVPVLVASRCDWHR